MDTIYKYELPLEGGVLRIPKDAQILTVAEQKGKLMFWVVFDLRAELVERWFEIYGTGNRMAPGSRTFIKTVFMGDFVWHVFEKLTHKNL